MAAALDRAAAAARRGSRREVASAGTHVSRSHSGASRPQSAGTRPSSASSRSATAAIQRAFGARARRARAGQIRAERREAGRDERPDLRGDVPRVACHRKHRRAAVADASAHMCDARFVVRMQQVPPVGCMTVAGELRVARAAPDRRIDAPFVVQQVGRLQHLRERAARAAQPDLRSRAGRRAPAGTMPLNASRAAVADSGFASGTRSSWLAG